MDTSKTQETGLLQTYGDALHTFVQCLRDKNPGYILAMPRKAPRLLELCYYWGMELNGSPIIGNKAINFVTKASLKAEKILIVDDIIIVGSTISWLVKDNPVLQNAEVLCLARHDKWFTEELFSEPNVPKKIPVSSIISLVQHDAAVFCTELVESIAYLNKPYDVDHPIFYGMLDYKNFERLCKGGFSDIAYEVSTSFQRSIHKRRISFIPDPVIEEHFIKVLFQSGKEVSPQIIKCRLYYDEITNNANFVPMLTFNSPLSNIEKSFFGEHFNEYNELIIDMTTSLNESPKAQAYHLLSSYITSYLYGLAFSVRNSNGDTQLIGTTQPSHFLNVRDLTYLIGPNLPQEFLHRLDGLYPRTIETIHRLFDDTVNSLKYIQTETKLPTPYIDLFAADSEAKRLLEEIKPYLDNNIPKRETLVDKVACIFEALFLLTEIPARHRIKAEKTLEGEERRLARGFNYDQIRQILINYKAVDSNDSSLDLRLSLVVVDILVDRGVMIPFYKEENGKFERFYGYGEDGLLQRKMGFLLAKTLDGLSKHMQTLKGRGYIPKVALEKILVLMKRKLGKNRKHVQFLQADGEAGMRTFDLKLDYYLHGAIVKFETEDEKGWLTRWCVDEGILEEGNGGYIYSEKFLNNLLAEGEVNAWDNSMVRSEVPPEYLELALPALYIDSAIDSSHESDYLICLSTCLNAESILDGMRKELEFLFEDNKKHSFGEGYSVGRLLEVLSKDLIGSYLSKGKTGVTGLWEKCDKELKNADKASNSLIHKYALFTRRADIIKDIDAHFHKLSTSDLNRICYEAQLRPIIIETEMQTSLMSREQILLKKLIEFGNLCVEICSILKNCSSLTQSIFEDKLYKTGRTWENVEQPMSEKVKAYLLREGGVEQKVKATYEEWRIKFSGSTFIYYQRGTLYNSGLRRDSNSAVFEAWKYIDNEKIAQLNGKIETTNNYFSGIQLLLVNEISTSYEQITKITEWAEIYRNLIVNINQLWYSMGRIYEQNYLKPSWVKIMETLYPTDAGISPFEWIIWYDIKDSQGVKNPENKEKTPHLKNAINLTLDNTRRNLKDGKFVPKTPEKDDARFILSREKDSIPIYLKVLLETLDSFDMFLRVGIASVYDTGQKFLQIPDSDSLESEINFALPKRLGECTRKENLKELREYNNLPDIPEETRDAHTVILSSEVWRQIWDRRSPFGELEHLCVDFVVRREHKIYVFPSVSKGTYLKIQLDK